MSRSMIPFLILPGAPCAPSLRGLLLLSCL